METAVAPMLEAELADFCRKVSLERSFDCTQFRQSYLRRRLQTRIRATGCRNLAEYTLYLNRAPDEWESLLDALTVNVTEFFRDPSMWANLEKLVIPAILEEKERRRQSFIRVWSAGCSSGQEPYSLAIAFREVLGSRAAAGSIRITATDFDRDSLERGRRGAYPATLTHNLAPHRVAANFVKTADGLQVTSELRHMVRFLHLDLFGSGTQRLMDLVMCRNVIMYFTPEQQRHIFAKFIDALMPRGFLVLGKSEKLPTYMTQHFEHFSMAERIYRKKPPEAAR